MTNKEWLKMVKESDEENLKEAFEVNGIKEIKDCLESVKQKLQQGYQDFSIMDSNGNKVGYCNLIEK
jgi:hypothetical protein